MILPSSLRRSVPLVFALLAIVMCACLVYAARSEQGKKIVLDKISTPEQTAALREIREVIQIINENANALDEFCDCPEKEAELGEKLIASINRFSEFNERHHDDLPATFVSFYEVASKQEQIRLALTNLNAATNRFVEESVRRKTDPEFETDDLLYKRIRIALASVKK